MHTGKASKKVGQREQLILALLQQPSLEKAAVAIGISTVTAWRISKTKEFKEEYRNARWEAFSKSLARLQQASGAAFSSGIEVLGTEAMKQLDVQRRRRGLRKLLSRPGQRHNRQKQLKSKPVRCTKSICAHFSQ